MLYLISLAQILTRVCVSSWASSSRCEILGPSTSKEAVSVGEWGNIKRHVARAKAAHVTRCIQSLLKPSKLLVKVLPLLLQLSWWLTLWLERFVLKQRITTRIKVCRIMVYLRILRLYSQLIFIFIIHTGRRVQLVALELELWFLCGLLLWKVA